VTNGTAKSWKLKAMNNACGTFSAGGVCKPALTPVPQVQHTHVLENGEK
jgi:hypothetical protein